MNKIEFTPQIIEAEHNRLGYQLGWRFLVCPAKRLNDAEVAIITLNPGGNRRVDTEWSQEEGNAYKIESWGGQASGTDKLQVQIQRMCKLLKVELDKTLSATFTPFRSPSWKDLGNKDQAIAFSANLWRWAIAQSNLKIFVCVGKDVTVKQIANIIGATRLEDAPSGWGDYKIERYKTQDGKVIIGLPHLSRFTLFGDARRDALFQNAIKDLW